MRGQQPNGEAPTPVAPRRLRAGAHSLVSTNLLTSERRQVPSQIAPLAVVALGLVLVGIWTDIVGYSASLLPTGGAVETDATSASYEYGRVLMALGFVLFARHIERNQAWLMALTAVVLAGTACGMFLAYHQSVYDQTAFAAVCSFLGGMGYILLATPFYLLMAHHAHARLAALFIALSLVGETLASTAISVGLGARAQVALAMAAPAAALACYLAARALWTRKTLPAADASSGPMFPEPARTGRERSLLTARLVLIAVAYAFIRTLSNVGMWGKDRANFLGAGTLSWSEIAAICLVVVLISLAVFVVPRRASNQIRSFAGLVVVLTGLQLLALDKSASFASRFDVITTSCELFSHLLTWMTFMECVCRLALPPFATRGIMVLVNTACTIALGFLPPSNAATQAVILVCMYAFALAFALLVIRATRHDGDPARPEGGDAAKPEEESEPDDPVLAGELHAFSCQNGLSAREEEVFALLLRGKTRSEIETICDLSEGTVRTHVNAVYKKLGVHSKADAQQRFAAFCEAHRT